MTYKTLLSAILYCSLAAAQPRSPLDLNSASAQEMQKAFEIDAATADKIIAHRPFHSMAELPGASIPPDVAKRISSRATIQSLPPRPNSMAAVPKPPANLVWVDTDKKLYYHSGATQYQTTRHGKLMPEAEAQKEGFKPGQ